jgi:hypothetical protein
VASFWLFTNQSIERRTAQPTPLSRTLFSLTLSRSHLEPYLTLFFCDLTALFLATMLETKETEYAEDMHPNPPPPYNPEYTVSSSSAPPAFNPEFSSENSIWSTLSAPAHLVVDDDDDDDIKDDDSSAMYPPFASAVPLYGDGFPDPATIPTHVDQVHVDEEPTPPPASASETHNQERSETRMTRHKCWLVPYAGFCARYVKRFSKVALKKAAKIKDSPNVQQAAHRSSTFVKKTSARSASFVQKKAQQSAVFCKDKSLQFKTQAVEFNEKHQVSPKAGYTVRMMGRQMKRASISTARGIQNLENKHHIRSKTQRGLSQGASAIRNAWNGKRSSV